MTLDTKALDNAADTFSRSMRALNSMELADLPPELDQDARNIARIIQEHGPDYASTEHGDMTAPLLESLARLVEAAKAADRLAALDAARHAYASEFPLNAEGEPDVGNIHQNIRALKQRLAALEAENSRLQAGIQLYKADFEHGLNGLKHEYAKLKQDNARLRGQISAMLGELEDFAMQNDLPIEDGHGYFGTGLPLRALQEWLFKQKDALAAGGDQ